MLKNLIFLFLVMALPVYNALSFSPVPIVSFSVFQHLSIFSGKKFSLSTFHLICLELIQYGTVCTDPDRHALDADPDPDPPNDADPTRLGSGSTTLDRKRMDYIFIQTWMSASPCPVCLMRWGGLGTGQNLSTDQKK
jgi:hypothetical protein